MKIGYIETFARFSESKNNIVSEQDLMAFQDRYDLTETEMEGIKEYCICHGISIVYAEDPAEKNGSDRDQSAGTYLPTQERRRIIRTIASHIVHKGAIRARKRAKRRGWLCGTYTSNIRKIIERSVEHQFTDEEIGFIKAHLSEDDETEFALKDSEKQEMCDDLNSKLNALIPRLHMNLLLSDFMDD